MGELTLSGSGLSMRAFEGDAATTTPQAMSSSSFATSFRYGL